MKSYYNVRCEYEIIPTIPRWPGPVGVGGDVEYHVSLILHSIITSTPALSQRCAEPDDALFCVRARSGPALREECRRRGTSERRNPALALCSAGQKTP